MIDQPYFMTDEGWYRFDYEKRRFVLTDKAPPKAEKSIKEFYAQAKESSH